MTYEEYKNKNNVKKNNYFKIILSKFYTIIIFTMIVIIISNSNSTFRNFLINDVLNNTMDFSKINIFLDKISGVYNKKEDKVVFNEIESVIEYMDGYKYLVNDNENIIMRDSGIITFIGEKEGYGNTVIIQQVNGIDLWYGNINNVSVKIYDYVEKGEVIGDTLNNDLYLVYKKEGKTLDYEEYIKG
jgi:hypothetical protein